MIVKTATGILSLPVRTTIEYKAEPPRAQAQPHLLVFDTDPLFLQLILRALSNHFQVCTVHNVLEGAKLLRRNNFDLILVDLAMPNGDGISLLQEIRDHTRLRQVPLLVLATSDELRKRIADMDVVAIVPKPHWLGDLSNTIHQALDLARSMTPESPADVPVGRAFRRA